MRTSRTVCRASSSCSRPARRRARRSCSRSRRAWCASARTRRASGSSRSSPTTAPRRSTRSRAARTSTGRASTTAPRSSAGHQLTGDDKTPLDPKKILEVKGIRETQQYLSDEVQKVYREQGVSIHDKHVEVIVRQMLRRVGVSEPGDSAFLPGPEGRRPALRRHEPSPRRRGQAARRGSSRAHGDHQGVARHRLVALGGVVPGDHPGAHRGGDRGPTRTACSGSRRT